MKAKLLVFASLAAAGCSMQPVIVSTQSLWPFEHVQIATSIGTLDGYLSRPAAAARRIVVAVQRSPCANEATEGETHTLVGTSGLLWRQFKDDSVFFQFERPGSIVASTSSCERANDDDENWQGAVLDAVHAVREHHREQLDHLPTVYVGIGAGAAPAIVAAAKDKHARIVALVSGTLESTDAALSNEQALRRLSVLVVHATEDSRTPVSRAEKLWTDLAFAKIRSAVLLFERVDYDFGLASGETDCFEVVARTVSEHVSAPTFSAAQSRYDCSAAKHDDKSDELKIESIERL